MNREAFISEIEKYSILDLELIINTQKDVYSAEEMQIIEEELEKKKVSEKEKSSDLRIVETLFCIVGLIVPVCGFIVGIVMMIAGSEDYKRIGKRTILASFISVVIGAFLMIGGFSLW